jgi:hypothetical protein
MKTKIYTLIASVLPLFAFAQLDGTDTTRISVGSKVVIVINDSTKTKEPKAKNFKHENHWAGFELGVNGLLSPNYKLNDNGLNNYMDLDYSKNIAIQLNIMEYNQPIINDKLFLMTGLGFRFNRYGFKNNVRVGYNALEVFGAEDSLRIYSKNLLKASYISVPLYLKVMPGKVADKSFHFAVGGVANYRISSKTKQKYEVEGQGYTDKVKGHYHLNPFLFDAGLRFGVGSFVAFANYSVNTLFEKNRGPESYPFTVGVRLIGF